MYGKGTHIFFSLRGCFHTDRKDVFFLRILRGGDKLSLGGHEPILEGDEDRVSILSREPLFGSESRCVARNLWVDILLKTVRLKRTM